MVLHFLLPFMASQWQGGLEDSNFKIHGHVYLFVIIFISLVIFFAILFLFVRWTCKYRRSLTTPIANANTTTSNTESCGLEAIVIDKLPICLHHGSVDEEVQCSVCLSAFQDQEKVKILPGCNHAYHPDCIDKWLHTHSSCPLCRSSLRTDSTVS